MSSADNKVVSTQELDIPFLVVLTTANVILFIIALFGNLLVIYLVISRPHMRTSVNNLFANMAAADLLQAVFIVPDNVKFLYINTSWFSGAVGTALCKSVNFLYAISIAVSIITLLFVSVDQFYAVLFPWRRVKLIRNWKAITALIWICSTIVMVPHAVAFQVKINNYGSAVCEYDWTPLAPTLTAGKIHFLLIFIFLYQLPLLLIAILYAFIARKLWFRKIPGNESEANRRSAEYSKRRVVRMLVIVITLFAVCWLPVHVFHFITFYNNALSRLIKVSLLLTFVSHTTSAVNPCLYITLNRNFRKEFISICKLICSLKCLKLSRINEVAEESRTPNARTLHNVLENLFKNNESSYHMTAFGGAGQSSTPAVSLVQFRSYENPLDITKDE